MARLSEGVHVHGEAYVSDNVEIGDYSSVMAGATIKRGAKVGSSTSIMHRATIGYNATIGNSVRIRPSSSVGDDCIIGGDVTIPSGCTIPDDTIIGSGATVIPLAAGPYQGSLFYDWNTEQVMAKLGCQSYSLTHWHQNLPMIAHDWDVPMTVALPVFQAAQLIADSGILKGTDPRPKQSENETTESDN